MLQNISFGALSLELTNYNKYLGLKLDEYMSFEGIGLSADSAGWAVGSIVSKLKACIDLGYSTYYQLYCMILAYARYWTMQLEYGDIKSGLLTGAIVVGVVAVARLAVDAQEGLVVVVLIPVEGGDPGEGALAVATHQAGGDSHQLTEGRAVLEQRSHHL